MSYIYEKALLVVELLEKNKIIDNEAISIAMQIKDDVENDECLDHMDARFGNEVIISSEELFSKEN